jgi:hypothetical protein
MDMQNVLDSDFLNMIKHLLTLKHVTNIFNNIQNQYIRICPYILESNPHPFYSFRGLKNQMRIRIECGLDSRSRAGFWKYDRAAVVTFFV